MDPVVDFNLDSLKSDESGNKDETADSSINCCNLESDKDFEIRTLIPNRDLEIHAVQTPTPEEPKFRIPSSSLATMESLEYSNTEGIYRFL